VICKPISAGDQPNPLGIPCYIGFERSDDLTDQSFIDLANAVFPGNNFSTASGAKSWMDSNGYWTSYSGSAGATGFTVTIVESGANVVMSASGSLNINDLTLTSSATGPLGGNGIGPNTATWIIGSTGQYFDEYTGFASTPSNFGSGGGAGPSSTTGDVIGVIFNGGPPYTLIVPAGYTTGTQITSTQTFGSQSFSSMGLVEGTYTYTWGTGPNADSINVVVGGTGATGSTGGTGGTGGTGSGAWYFYYSTEGPLSVGPPTSPGNTIFLTAAGGNQVFNPNRASGTNQIYFNRYDDNGIDYGTQFNTLMTNGGTISFTQNGQTATYTTSTPNEFQYNSASNGFLLIPATVTQSATCSAFVYGDPISLSFS
jgi:hypothetical protein